MRPQASPQLKGGGFVFLGPYAYDAQYRDPSLLSGTALHQPRLHTQPLLEPSPYSRSKSALLASSASLLFKLFLLKPGALGAETRSPSISVAYQPGAGGGTAWRGIVNCLLINTDMLALCWPCAVRGVHSGARASSSQRGGF